MKGNFNPRSWSAPELRRVEGGLKNALVTGKLHVDSGTRLASYLKGVEILHAAVVDARRFPM